MQWIEIKNVYKKWPVNIFGYHMSPELCLKIGHEAIVDDSASIGDAVEVGDGAEISARANIGNMAKIGHGVKIGHGANICMLAKIGNRAEIGEWAEIGYAARVGNGAKIVKQLTYILGSRDPMYLYDPDKRMIGIGRIVKPISGWLAEYVEVGNKYKYTGKQIKEYLKYIKLFDEILSL